MASKAQPLSQPLLNATILMLQGSPPHWRESFALYAILVGIDRFEASIDDIAMRTQYSRTQLQAFVDSARQAPLAPVVQRQHLVSDKLLRGWAKGNCVSHYRLPDAGLNPDGGPVRTKDVAYLENFVKLDSQETEDLWGKTESNIHSALKAIRGKKLFQNPQHIKTLRDLVALHYTRSHEVLRESNKTYKDTTKTARTQLMNQLALDPSLSDLNERRLAVNGRMKPLRDLHKNGVIFRFRIVDLFEGAKQAVANAGIRVLHPKQGSEFLISDAPVIMSAIPNQRHDISSGFSIGNAFEVYLPLRPKFAVVLTMKNPKNSYVEITADEVERYNRWEVEAAVNDVIMRPGSYLEQFPQTVRPLRRK